MEKNERKTLTLEEAFDVCLKTAFWLNQSLLKAMAEYIKQTSPDNLEIFASAYNKAVKETVSTYEDALKMYDKNLNLKDLIEKFTPSDLQKI